MYMHAQADRSGEHTLHHTPKIRGYEAALWTSTGVCAASALCALPLLGKLYVCVLALWVRGGGGGIP